MAHRLYSLTGPTRWAGPPEAFSFSSLKAMERCPLQWQLAHSGYGELDGFPARPQSAAVEGEIVHAVLERLFRGLALAGFPAPGSEGFRAEVARVDPPGSVRRLVRAQEDAAARHPRGHGFRLTRNEQQLSNQVIRLFRETYNTASAVHRPTLPQGDVTPFQGAGDDGKDLAVLLRERRALSELPVRHPTLPFRGVIDLLWLSQDGVVVTDFKTGQEREEHALQVRCYALVWWRLTGTIPVRAELRYPDRVRAVELTERPMTVGVGR
jgi:hypothetical protein